MKVLCRLSTCLVDKSNRLSQLIEKKSSWSNLDQSLSYSFHVGEDEFKNIFGVMRIWESWSDKVAVKLPEITFIKTTLEKNIV